MSAKVPPNSEENEKGVLSSMLIGGREVVGRVYERIRMNHEEWFYTPRHALIYVGMIDLWKDGIPIDEVTVQGILSDQGNLEKVGGIVFITQIAIFVPSAVNVNYYLDDLSDKRWLRYVIQAGIDTTRDGYEAQDDVEGALRNVESRLMELTQRHASYSRQRSISEITTQMIENLEDPERSLGISTGYAKLDALAGGLAPCVKICIAGKTSGGKSAFAANLANHIAVIHGHKTAVFTYEMSAEQWVQRIAQINSGVSARSVVGSNVDLFNIQRFQGAASAISESNLIVTNDRLDITGIRARCMQIKPRVAIIDYLQIIPELKQKGENTTDKLDRMSAETKQIAHQLGITVIELSQLTTDEKTGSSKTRGSSGITNDSDMLWIIEGDDDDEKTVIDKWLIVPKQRYGPKGRVPFSFNKPCTKFTEK